MNSPAPLGVVPPICGAEARHSCILFSLLIGPNQIVILIVSRRKKVTKWRGRLLLDLEHVRTCGQGAWCLTPSWARKQETGE